MCFLGGNHSLVWYFLEIIGFIFYFLIFVSVRVSSLTTLTIFTHFVVKGFVGYKILGRWTPWLELTFSNAIYPLLTTTQGDFDIILIVLIFLYYSLMFHPFCYLGYGKLWLANPLSHLSSSPSYFLITSYSCRGLLTWHSSPKMFTFWLGNYALHPKFIYVSAYILLWAYFSSWKVVFYNKIRLHPLPPDFNQAMAYFFYAVLM